MCFPLGLWADKRENSGRLKGYGMKREGILSRNANVRVKVFRGKVRAGVDQNSKLSLKNGRIWSFLAAVCIELRLFCLPLEQWTVDSGQGWGGND